MNKRSILVLLFSILTLLSTSLSAQEQRLLTLEQSIEIAKQNSPLARAANFALISAKWRYKSFKADLLPSLELSGDAPNFNRAFQQNVEDGITRYYYSTQSDASARLSINQNIMPTGGTLSLISGVSKLGIFKGEDTYLWKSTPFVATLIQPIFQFNSLKWRYLTEPLRYRIAQKQHIEDMEELAFTTTQSFFDFLLAKINVEVAAFNVMVNDSIYKISTGRYNVGSIAENDLLQSELAFRNAETALNTAQLNLQRTEENFKALLGIPNDINVEVSAPENAPSLNIDLDRAMALAQENNSTYLQFRLNEIQADQSYDRAIKEAGFSATIQASYGFNQTSENIAQLYENPENQSFFTVGFDIPIFNWGKNTAEIRAAKNEQAATANTIEYQKLQFDLDVRSTVREFSQLQSQVELAEVSDEIADRRYEVAKNRYLIGKIDVTNLFIAQNEKDAARRNYIQALRNYWTGYYNLRRLTLYDFENNREIRY